MKEYIFKQYIDNICAHLGIHSSDLFVKSREAGVVEARQLLFFLCHTRQKMGYTEIKKYTDNVGFEQDVTNISYHVEKMQERISEDPDYINIVNKLDKIEY
jgi:chromosomal replication initiation ATPase DnaA